MSVGGVLCRINNLDGSVAGEDTVQTWLKLLAAASEREVNMRRNECEDVLERKVTLCRRREGFVLPDQLLVFGLWVVFISLTSSHLKTNISICGAVVVL